MNFHLEMSRKRGWFFSPSFMSVTWKVKVMHTIDAQSSQMVPPIRPIKISEYWLANIADFLHWALTQLNKCHCLGFSPFRDFSRHKSLGINSVKYSTTTACTKWQTSVYLYMSTCIPLQFYTFAAFFQSWIKYENLPGEVILTQ